jgi:oligoribonuclease NrnB/cAMP/cGMP phosphodiesterase (DHH superfamily)
MSPPEDQFLEVLQNGGVIMDHHTTVKHLFDQHMEEFSHQLLWGENDRSESGAVLAFIAIKPLVYRDNIVLTMQRAAQLVGLGDTWQKDHPDFELARAFANLVDLVGNDYEGLYEERELAEKLWASKKKAFARSAEKAIWREVLDKRVAFVNTLKTSDVAELLRAKGANIIVGFAEMYDPDRQVEWVGFSMRSDESWDCSAFAKKYGGGGHVPAAGFGQVRDEVMAGQGNTIDWFCRRLHAHNYAEWSERQ